MYYKIALFILNAHKKNLIMHYRITAVQAGYSNQTNKPFHVSKNCPALFPNMQLLSLKSLALIATIICNITPAGTV